MSNVPYLRIGNLNCCSLRNKTEEVLTLVAEQDLDILCITESWLSPKDDALAREISEHNYKLLNVARGSRGGGVAIIHKEEIKVKKCKLRKTFSTFELLETVIDGPGIDLTRVAVLCEVNTVG